MAIIKAFKGIRPIKDKVAEIASPPYDVMNSQEARVFVENNPISFLHVVKPEVDLPEDINIYDDQVYQKGRENFDKLINDGNLIQDRIKALYIYKQIMGSHQQIGIVACTSVDDYKNDIIKKHEHTREVKENDRAKHVEVLDANAGPVFLTYKSNHQIKKIIDYYIEAHKPEYDFTDELNVKHILYVVKEEYVISELVDLFARIDYLYVADGHHRSAAGTRVAMKKREENPNFTGKEEFNYFLSVIFPDDEMLIMDYNRVVKDLNGMNKDELINKIEENFDIKEWNGKCKPEKSHDFGMYIDNKWYKLSAKESIVVSSDPVKSLDAYILQEHLLSPVLGIGDPRKDKRIKFVGGIRGLEELEKLVDSGDFKVAFSMFPTSITSLMNVADAGKVMPPKSTWF
ncbi:DUF1015 domain-containing protein, partial [candidate division WOR-3 bacterium]|nr:DUF1015 domain-containing protein [candidate division WOR-3 bacterium]